MTTNPHVKTFEVGNGTRHEVVEHLSTGRPSRVTAWLLRDGDDAAHVVETCDLLTLRPVWRTAR